MHLALRQALQYLLLALAQLAHGVGGGVGDPEWIGNGRGASHIEMEEEVE